MARLLETLIKPEDKKKREKITEYLIYHNYDMYFRSVFDWYDQDICKKHENIFEGWEGIEQSYRNCSIAILPLTYDEFSKTYPKFKNYVQPEKNCTYNFIMPEKVESKYDSLDLIERRAESDGYYDQLICAVELVTTEYGMEDKIDVEDIIQLLGEPFKYMSYLLTYLTVFGFTITRGDCTWEYIKIPYSSSYNPEVWCFVNLDRPVVDPTSVRYVNPNG